LTPAILKEILVAKPFHETIVDHMHPCAENFLLVIVLGRLIKDTIIPANHDAIAAAWKKMLNDNSRLSELSEEVLAHLRQQKEIAESKVKIKSA